MRQILILIDQIEQRDTVVTDRHGQSRIHPEVIYSKVANRHGLFHGWTHVERPQDIIELPSGEIELVPYDHVRFV